MVNNSIRKISTPISIAQKSVKTFISGAVIKMFVSPGVSMAFVTQIEETTSFDHTAEFRNQMIISRPRAKLFSYMHNDVHVTHTNERQVLIRHNKTTDLSPDPSGSSVMRVSINTD